jgi:hypothetical protein
MGTFLANSAAQVGIGGYPGGRSGAPLCAFGIEGNADSILRDGFSGGGFFQARKGKKTRRPTSNDRFIEAIVLGRRTELPKIFLFKRAVFRKDRV